VTDRQMTKPKSLKLTVQNKNYGEFNGFTIEFVGFAKIPWRFSGLGFAAGKHLLEQLKERFGEFELVVAKDARSTFNDRKTPAKIILKYDDILEIRRDFRRKYRSEAEKTVIARLAVLFPRQFTTPDDTAEPSALEETLPEGIRKITLSNEDIQEASHLLPLLPLMEKHGITSKTALRGLLAGRKVVHYLHLERVLREFRKRLKDDLSEPDWQMFFRNNLLILNPGYIEIIEKPNISLAIRFPDFLLLTVEDYADVYEIKRPGTVLLKYDSSHKNYYWSPEISKAIAQVENYIESLEKYKDSVIQEIKNSYELELKILRPRGYIIAGISSQLRPLAKNEDFRLLNQSLRNTEVLPYDMFFQRFDNLSRTLKQAVKS
jgi:hypothetical protein